MFTVFPPSAEIEEEPMLLLVHLLAKFTCKSEKRMLALGFFPNMVRTAGKVSSQLRLGCKSL